MGLRMPSTGQQEVVLRSLILALICAVAFSTRLFSVLRYESIIHEFDPWFNFRATRYVGRLATSPCVRPYFRRVPSGGAPALAAVLGALTVCVTAPEGVGGCSF